jgi:hypothetical protein
MLSIRHLLLACFFNDQTGDARGQLLEMAREVETADTRRRVTEIVDNAAQLAGDIRHSRGIYDNGMVLNSNWVPGRRILHLDNMYEYTIIDSSTGAPITTPAKVEADRTERVSDIPFVVFPAFIKQASEKEENMLVKPTVVVKFDHPVRKAEKGKARRGRQP